MSLGAFVKLGNPLIAEGQQLRSGFPRPSGPAHWQCAADCSRASSAAAGWAAGP